MNVRRLLLFVVLVGCAFAIGLIASRAAAPDTGGRTDDALLRQLDSPRVLRGNDRIAYRDAMLHYDRGTFYLFYSYVREEEDRLIYWYVGVSRSRDLVTWSEPRVLTPKDQNLNYSSPGNLVRVGDEWVLTLQSYPIAGFRRGDKLRFADARARIFTMRSRDLEMWSAPELLRVKGPAIDEAGIGKMIDPFLLRDREDSGKWWCFYKQAGKVVASVSRDLKVWTPSDLEIAHGENPCVLVDGNDYVLFYAPANGVGVKRSADLVHWRDEGPPITLGQKEWPWAENRLTAGYVTDLRAVPGVGKFVMVCHSMGPGLERTDANTNAGCSIVIAWSDDLKTWAWPGKRSASP